MLGTCGYIISAHIWPFSIDLRSLLRKFKTWYDKYWTPGQDKNKLRNETGHGRYGCIKIHGRSFFPGSWFSCLWPFVFICPQTCPGRGQIGCALLERSFAEPSLFTPFFSMFHIKNIIDYWSILIFCCIVIYTHTDIYIYICIYRVFTARWLYLAFFWCVCVCVCCKL